jgi:hypothetical protein
MRTGGCVERLCCACVTMILWSLFACSALVHLAAALSPFVMTVVTSCVNEGLYFQLDEGGAWHEDRWVR